MSYFYEENTHFEDYVVWNVSSNITIIIYTESPWNFGFESGS